MVAKRKKRGLPKIIYSVHLKVEDWEHAFSSEAAEYGYERRKRIKQLEDLMGMSSDTYKIVGKEFVVYFRDKSYLTNPETIEVRDQQGRAMYFKIGRPVMSKIYGLVKGIFSESEIKETINRIEDNEYYILYELHYF